MKKQVKPKSKRTQVKDLPVEQQELTNGEAAQVKGGHLRHKMFAVVDRTNLTPQGEMSIQLTTASPTPPRR